MAMNTLTAHRPGSVGKPVRGNQLRVSSDGNVQVKGPGVFRGYLGDTGDGQLDDQSWYDTGDLGTIDGGGYLTLTGRSGDIIKTSTGRRIAPGAIESTLQAVAGIDQAVLVGANRKYLVAICTCLPSDSPAATIASLRAPLASALATLSAHERPAAIGFLPRAFDIQSGEVTTNLKLRRSIIAQQHQALIDHLYEVIDSKSPPPDHILVFS